MELDDDEPKMRKFTGYVTTNYVGARRDFTFEVEEDATEEEITERATEALFQTIEWDYSEVEPE